MDHHFLKNDILLSGDILRIHCIYFYLGRSKKHSCRKLGKNVLVELYKPIYERISFKNIGDFELVGFCRGRLFDTFDIRYTLLSYVNIMMLYLLEYISVSDRDG